MMTMMESASRFGTSHFATSVMESFIRIGGADIELMEWVSKAPDPLRLEVIAVIREVAARPDLESELDEAEFKRKLIEGIQARMIELDNSRKGDYREKWWSSLLRGRSR